MRRALGLALMVLLAGCVGQEDPPPVAVGQDLEPAVIVDPLPPGEDAALATAEVPLWRVGDAWAITPLGPDGEPGFLVVTAADADSYTLEPTSGTLASWDAMYDVSFVGKIRSSDLAGRQADEAIRFFDFPLADGKTWTTTWDGREVALAATKTARGFAIAGTVDRETYVTYDYDPSLRWWSKLAFAEGYGIQVTRVVEGWTGDIAVATAKLVYESGATAPVLSGGAGTFVVDEGQHALSLSVMGGGVLWLRGFVLFDPAGEPVLSDTPNVQLSEGVGEPSWYRYQEELTPTPGEWRIASPTLHSPDAHGMVHIHEVALAMRAFP